MVRLKRRPFPAAVGTISVLTAVLVLAGCAKGNDPAAEKPDSEDAVLYVGDEPVSEAEYRMLAEKYSNQIYMQYTTEQVNSADFWQTETDGTAPWELLDELVQEELQYNYTLKDLAVELSVEEDYTYQELMEDREQENADREVTNALVEKETSVTEEECRAYYDDNPDTFSYEDGVTVLYAEFPYTQDDSAESDVQAQRMKKAMESTDSLSELSEAFPDASLQKLDLNSLDTQEGMSGVYTYRWQTASQMQEGQIFGPYEDNGMLCIMKCTDRTGDGSLDFAAVKGQIERYPQARQTARRM